MNAFYDRKYDILLATTIIESGLDIPTANTIIIHNANMFGLAQLKQNRGRRSHLPNREPMHDLTSQTVRNIQQMHRRD